MDFDIDKAASAFPDIEGMDGPIEPTAPAASNGFSFDDFGPAPARNVTVTESDDFDKFESDFPELEPQVRVLHS
jgi:hypothetical protein